MHANGMWIIQRGLARCLGAWVLAWLAGASLLLAAPPAEPLTPDALDLPACQAWSGSKALGPAPVPALLAALGLAVDAPAAPAWTSGPGQDEVRHFRLVLRQPIALGTLATPFAGQVSWLRPEAALPGDPLDEAQWLPLPGGALKLLPVGQATRALRFTEKRFTVPWSPGRPTSTFPPVRFASERFYSPALQGGREQQTQEKATHALAWWARELPLAGLLILGPPPRELASLPASVAEHPMSAPATTWATLPAPATGWQAGWQLWDTPLPAQAWRVSWAGAAPTGPSLVLPLVRLPAEAASAPPLRQRPPLSLPLDLPFPGFLALHLSDAKGQHVRRLIAEVERRAGPQAEPWDLTDDLGQPVPPGEYQWRAVIRPPLKLTYEMTVYNPGQPPWFAPVPGGGSWMADHAPPQAVCAVGEHMFFGAGGAEFGVPLIATDLTGRKVWSEGHQGAQRLVSDGRFAYVVNFGEIFRIDPQARFKMQRIHGMKYSEDLPAPPGAYHFQDDFAAAARPGLMAVSINGREPAWLRSTFSGGEVDLRLSYPPPEQGTVHETDLTYNERILSAFQVYNSSTRGEFGKADSKGALSGLLVLALRREAPIGTVLVPNGALQVRLLRPGRPLPAFLNAKESTADPTLGKGDGEGFDLGGEGLGDLDTRFKEEDWELLPPGPKGRPALLTPPKGTRSRLLVFSGPGLSALDYSFVLNRRYQDLTPSGRWLLSEGKLTPTGGWAINRPPDKALSPGQPALAALVWDQPVAARGVTVLRPLEWADWGLDVYTGPADQPISAEALADNKLWQEVHQHRQVRNHVKFSWHTDKVVTADFGRVRELRAVRLRLHGHPAGAGLRGPTAATSGFAGFITYGPAGNDLALPVSQAQRLTLLKTPAPDSQDQAKVLGHLPLPGAGPVAFAPDGTLYAIGQAGLLRLPDLGQGVPAEFTLPAPLVPRAALGRPRDLLITGDGQALVLDGQTGLVKVFDLASGEAKASIGRGGNFSAGPWDPTRFTTPVSMALDTRDKLWVVEAHFQPKRISRWTRAGVFEKEWLGPTHYGGGGHLDPRDKTVINHYGMKFRLDFATRTWKLESRLWPMNVDGLYLPERVFYVGERRYLAGDRDNTLFGDPGPIMSLFTEVNGAAKPLVSAGGLGSWGPFQRSRELQAAFAKFDPEQSGFVWSDLDGDGQVQVAEMQVLDAGRLRQVAGLGDDLSLNFRGHRLRAVSVDDRGVPRYDVAQLQELPGLTGATMVTPTGETFVMGHHLLNAAGEVVWRYPDRYSGVQASMRTPFGFTARPAGVLAGALRTAGTFELAGERYFTVNGNNGDYYAFTHDGLLAAAILGGPQGYGNRYFSMPDCVPGETDLSDLRKTIEDFYGHVTTAEDGKLYAIAGKNHVTLIRVDGLERLQRLSGKVTVTPGDLTAARQWAEGEARLARLLERPRQATAVFFRKPPVLDGETEDWPAAEPMNLRLVRGIQDRLVEFVEARLGFDSEHLYLFARGLDGNPLANRATEPAICFQTGDAFDLQLGLDPAADPARRDAAPGDLRLLFALLKDQPSLLFMRYQGDGPTKVGAPRRFESPVAHTEVADLGLLSAARVHLERRDVGGAWWFHLEAAIPWKALGWQPPRDQSFTLRGDLGVLDSDPNGIMTVSRTYWANRQFVAMGDQPLEARVHPALWGEWHFRLPSLAELMTKPEETGGAADGLLLP